MRAHHFWILAAFSIVLAFAIEPACAQTNATERGLIKWNGNNVGAGQSIT